MEVTYRGCDDTNEEWEEHKMEEVQIVSIPKGRRIYLDQD
jgi:hypothetical protein